MRAYECAICREDYDSDSCSCLHPIKRLKGSYNGMSLQTSDNLARFDGGGNSLSDMAGSPLDVQVGGSHYKDMAIQPVEFIHKNGMGFLEGNIVKYICRFRAKNGIEDLKKARHYLDILIEAESVDR